MTVNNYHEKRILLVEDETLIAMSVAEELRKEFFSVETRGSGESAVEMISESPDAVDLILMDINLGRGIDGTEAARRILAIRNIPVLFLSSHNENEIVTRTESITSYGYILKSSGITVLSASIRMAFRLNDALMEVKEKSDELEAALEELQETTAELEETNAQLTDSSNEVVRKEERLRSTLDSMIEGCQILGFDWTYLYINESAARWGRKSREELIGRTVTECYPGIESQPVFAVLSECMTNRTRRREEIEFSYSDGTSAVFEFIIQPVPEGLFVLTMDITDRINHETILHESDQRFRTLVENSPDGIFIQTNGLFAYANESMRKMIDPAGARSLIGEEVVRFFAPEYRDIVNERIRLLNIERRAVPRNEEVLVDVNGNRIVADIIAIPIDFKGVHGSLVYAHDISIRKKAEDELQQMIKLKDTLMAELQHRVKNSLAIINSLITFESSKITDESTKQVFSNAQSRIHVMAGIYEMLYSSQETSLNNVRLDMYVHKLTSTIASMCDSGNRMALSFDMDEVSFDLKRTVIVCLILNELVTNAIKHSCAIDMTCSVFISLKMEENVLKLTVTDRSTEMPDIEPKTGTGLSLVRLLMKEIHAEMMTSKENGYNTSITFPYQIL